MKKEGHKGGGKRMEHQEKEMKHHKADGKKMKSHHSKKK